MANLQTKGDMGTVLGASCSIIEILEDAIKNRDETRFIFSDKDFLEECIIDGHIDPKLFETYCGATYRLSLEEAALATDRLSAAHIDTHLVNVLTQDGKERDGEIPCRESALLLTSKRGEKAAKEIISSLPRAGKEVTKENLINRSKETGKELSVIRNIDKAIFNNMADHHVLPSAYSVNDHGKTVDITIPSADRGKMIGSMLNELSHFSGYEKEMMETENERRVSNSRSILDIARDDKKSIVVMDHDSDKHDRGIAIDKDGFRDVILRHDKMYVANSISRNDQKFLPYLNDLLKNMGTPAVAHSEAGYLKKDDISKAMKETVPLDSPKTERDNIKDRAVSYKNYIIGQYYNPYIMEVLERMGNAKWHAIANGLVNEDSELDKDIAEGTASAGNKTKKTLTGIDLNTVNHDGFNLEDLGEPTPADKFAELIGISADKAEELGFYNDMEMIELMEEDHAAQAETIRELNEYIRTVQGSTIEYGEPSIKELERDGRDREQEQEIDLDR